MAIKTAAMQGFTLLEVLITLFIISLGMLGIVGMQLSALQHSRAAYEHSVAIVQVNAMLERLRANRSDLARRAELDDWNQTNQRLLPQSKGSYRCEHNDCTVTLVWSGKQVQQLSLSAQVW